MMTTLLMLAGAGSGLAFASEEIAEVQDFEQGFGDWQSWPRHPRPAVEGGWELVVEDGDTVARNQARWARWGGTWLLHRVVDLSQKQAPRLEAMLDFHGHRYDHVALRAGPPGGPSSSFVTLARLDEATGGPVTLPVDLSEWEGEEVELRLLLSRRPGGVAEPRPGLTVHRLDLFWTEPDPEPDPDPAPEDPLRIGAFNIQVFGVAKMDRPGVPEILSSVVQRYDLLLIQEIRDRTGESIEELLALVNAEAEQPYEMALSDRLGRTSSKEQYAFIYRPDRLSVLDSYHYDDGIEPDEDLFEREPFVVRFLTTTGLDFAAVALHADPDAVPLELEALYDVQLDAAERWEEPDILLMGDLNADCSYLSPSEQQALSLFLDPSFAGWIDDDTDTTVSSTHCAYDRILSTGALSNQVLSAGVFRFDLEHGLDGEQALQVSDHYPVEVELSDE